MPWRQSSHARVGRARGRICPGSSDVPGLSRTLPRCCFPRVAGASTAIAGCLCRHETGSCRGGPAPAATSRCRLVAMRERALGLLVVVRGRSPALRLTWRLLCQPKQAPRSALARIKPEAPVCVAPSGPWLVESRHGAGTAPRRQRRFPEVGSDSRQRLLVRPSALTTVGRGQSTDKRNYVRGDA